MALQVSRNGVVDTSAGPSDELLYWNHIPYTHDPAGTWKQWNGTAWIATVDPTTGPTAVPGVPTSFAIGQVSATSVFVTFGPPSTGGGIDVGGYQTQYKANASGTYLNGQTVQVITPGHGSIVLSGNTWTVGPDAKIYQNLTLDAVTNGVVLLMLINGQFWQVNTANNWYWKVQPADNWMGPITTSPLVSPGARVVSTLPATSPFNFRMYAFNSFGNGSNTTVLNQTTAAVQSSFTTEGASIRDPSGNLWTFKSIGWWEGYGNPAWFAPMWDLSWRHSLDACKALGFNCVRLGMSMQACLNPASTPMRSDMTVGNNSDLAGKNLMEFYDLVIDYCGTIGIYCLMDMHNTNATGHYSTGFTSDGLFTLTGGASGWSRDGYTDADYINAWSVVATRWAGKAAFAACDMMNEPWQNDAGYLGSASKISLKDLYTRAGNAIHSAVRAASTNYPLPLIVCQLPEGAADTYSGGDYSAVGGSPIALTNADKVVYAPHIYPSPWNNGQPDSGNSAMDYWNRSWGYLVTNNQQPLWITEWGGTNTGRFANAQAYWSTLVPYMLGTSGYNGAPTKRIHWSAWNFAKETADDTGLILDMVFPNPTFTTRVNARNLIQSLIAAAPT